MVILNTMMIKKKILLIEDEHDLAETLRNHLIRVGMDVTHCDNGIDGLKTALAETWDLVLLDIMLPGLDGFEICRKLRNDRPHLPIIMITARSEEVDRILGLEFGADDYITKPFSLREVLARIVALLRRIDTIHKSYLEIDSEIVVGNLEIFPHKLEVKIRGKIVNLTPKEFDLLLFLAKHPGKCFRRGNLLDQVWGYDFSGYNHTINSHINRLRAKIEDDPNNPEYILTVWGVGYKLNENLS